MTLLIPGHSEPGSALSFVYFHPHVSNLRQKWLEWESHWCRQSHFTGARVPATMHCDQRKPYYSCASASAPPEIVFKSCFYNTNLSLTNSNMSKTELVVHGVSVIFGELKEPPHPPNKPHCKAACPATP